jgi:ABC-type dipeptide/oligopeptide/nickel transport system permease subunit
LRKKLGIEAKLGLFFISLYLIWSLGWFFYCYILNGSLGMPYRPIDDLSLELLPPLTSGFLFGTDVFGRSLMETISAGLLYSFGIGLLVSIMAATLGIIIGYMSALGSKWIRTPFDLLTNIIFVFPSILIAILFMSVIGPSYFALVFLLTVTGWPAYAKIVRVEVKRIYSQSFVEASVANGISGFGLFFKVILPNILPIVLVQVCLGMSGVIISEATLGFLGIGGSEYSFGANLSLAKSVLLEAPHMTIIYSLILGGLIMGLNLLGDGFRDYLDPKNNVGKKI